MDVNTNTRTHTHTHTHTSSSGNKIKIEYKSWDEVIHFRSFGTLVRISRIYKEDSLVSSQSSLVTKKILSYDVKSLWHLELKVGATYY